MKIFSKLKLIWLTKGSGSWQREARQGREVGDRIGAKENKKTRSLWQGMAAAHLWLTSTTWEYGFSVALSSSFSKRGGTSENARMQTDLLFRKCYLDKCFKRNIFCAQNSQCWVQLSSISTHQCLREDTGRVQLTCQELQKCLPSRAWIGPDEKNSLRPDMGLPSLERCSVKAVKGRTWLNLPDPVSPKPEGCGLQAP